MRSFTLFFLLLAFVSSSAQVEVSAFGSGLAEGVTYCLPNTQVDIKVESRCIIRTPGEFCRFADRYLHIMNPVQEESKEWELVDVTVKTIGLPDKQKSYTINVDNSMLSNIQLNEKGVINAINCKVKEEKEKVVENKTVKRVNPRRYFTEEIMQATSTAKMAELVAKEIYTIRESKLAITRGQSENMPKDGVSMQLVLDELNLQEKTLTELFTGRVDTAFYTSNILFTPTENSDTTRAVLFRFSRRLGVLERDNLAGAPVYYDFEAEKKIVAPVEENGKKKKTIKKEGICYTLPGRAMFKIYNIGETFFEENLSFAQLGTVEVLSKKIFSKNSDVKILFDTATGGIISIDK